jgi:hypothetical protein
LIVTYDDDPASAAEALLAVLRPGVRCAGIADESPESSDDEAADAA